MGHWVSRMCVTLFPLQGTEPAIVWMMGFPFEQLGPSLFNRFHVFPSRGIEPLAFPFEELSQHGPLDLLCVCVCV